MDAQKKTLRRKTSYLYQHKKSGLYYFRIRIPTNFLSYFKSNFFKKSLNTDSRKLATQRALLYKIEFDNLLSRLSGGDTFKIDFKDSLIDDMKNKETQRIQLITYIRADDGDNFVIDCGGDLAKERKEAVQLKKDLDELKQQQTIDQKEQKELPKKILLSEAINEYIAHKKIETKQVQSGTGIKQSLDMLIMYIGDMLVGKITEQMLKHEYLDKLNKLPNRKLLKYKDKTTEELLNTDIPDSDLLQHSTKARHISNVNNFFEYLSYENYITSNVAKILTTGLKITARKDDSSDRERFTHDDLKRLFEHEHSNRKQKISIKNRKYWLRVIALYTGARIEEIIRIKLENIKQDDGIHYFLLEADPDGWKAKNKKSLREIPIHKNLIKLGLLDYADTLRKAGKTRLFYDLVNDETMNKSVERGEKKSFSATESTSFSELLKKLDIKQDDGKCFHSFRHTFLDELKQSGVERSIAEDIAGHERHSGSNDKYTNKHNIKTMYDALCKLDYKLNHIKPPDSGF